jgi:hypothetical protein
LIRNENSWLNVLGAQKLLAKKAGNGWLDIIRISEMAS